MRQPFYFKSKKEPSHCFRCYSPVPVNGSCSVCPLKYTFSGCCGKETITCCRLFPDTISPERMPPQTYTGSCNNFSDAVYPREITTLHPNKSPAVMFLYQNLIPMKKLALITLAVAMLTACNTTSDPGTPVGDPGNGGLILPEGFTAIKVAEDLGRGRHLVVADNGDIYMALRNMKNGNGAVALRDTSDDG